MRHYSEASRCLTPLQVVDCSPPTITPSCMAWDKQRFWRSSRRIEVSKQRRQLPLWRLLLFSNGRDTVDIIDSTVEPKFQERNPSQLYEPVWQGAATGVKLRSAEILDLVVLTERRRTLFSSLPGA